MSNYNSKHTGAQIDEAVSKVLNGEVGGGGGATPDWHASEREPGHIVGRTHFIDYPLCILNKENTSEYVGTFDVVYVAYNDNIETLENEKPILLSGGLVRIEYNDNTVSLIESDPGLINVVVNYDIRIFGVISKLNDLFIPDTVIKTTPQSLSDADKNQALDNLGIKDKIDKLLNITYLNLKSLRDNSQLVPGQQYRITDYNTTTLQENTQSAGHPFDVIVIADDVNVLNENARAIQHKGDTYFTNSDLNTWELKYCLDNDTNRFAWADTTNGKGVIYYMKDEWNNECPYDFKNIQFARWELSNPVGYINYYDFDNWEDSWTEEPTPFDSLKTGFYGMDGSNNVFYYGYNDEYECNKYRVEYTISELPTYCYTFGNGTDYSISDSNYGNVIKEYKSINKIQLNNIVFLGKCFNNSFGNNCSHNSFGVGCSSNSFGKTCTNNSFGNYCHENSFGNDCHYNSFCYSCFSNSFGNACYSNIFGSNCYYNSFGNSCDSNSFDKYNSNNSFGDDCDSNSFGDDCRSNSLGNSCSYNSFGNSCESNSFGNDCYYNSFGESCTNPKSYYCYIIFDHGNRHINLNCTSTTSSSKYYQNVRIGLGVNNSDIYKTINDSNVDQKYQTVYKPAESKELNA